MNNAADTKTVHLQFVGKVPAVEASELKAGQITVWNHGFRYEVLAVERLSPKFVRIAMASIEADDKRSDKVCYRRSTNQFLVGVAS